MSSIHERAHDLGLDEAQLTGLTDMDPERFRSAAHEVVDLMADYLATVEDRAVFPALEPGELIPSFAAHAPDGPEPLEAILADYRALIEPNVTHWQHPGFFAYFASSGSGPGILAEMLMSTIVSNAMLWRTSPAATELEQVVVTWIREALGLPASFDGLFTDTASTSSLIALAAAREQAVGAVAARGLHGRDDVPALRVYGSREAHSSIDKACMTLGLGRDALVHVGVDDALAMRPDLLEAAIAEDRAAGRLPVAIVATIGTTSSTVIDPVAAIAGIAEREGVWLHVDAAYAGAAALVPSRRGAFEGWERADSIVTNPHKWWFTPLDASLLVSRRMEAIRTAFSLVPEYLRTLDRERPVHDYNEYTPQLGRRFRALKLWFILRYFGLDGMRRRIDAHCEMASAFAEWVDADPDFERLAPVPFSTVCFRLRPADAGLDEEALTTLNTALLDAVNRRGDVFLSHTKLDGRFTIRLAIGNVRTEPRHVERAWELIREEAARLRA